MRKNIFLTQKKLNSYIKKFLFFTLRYISPTSVLIFVFINDDFNKWFILKVILLFGVLLFSIASDYVIMFTVKHSIFLIKETANQQNKITNLIIKLIDITVKTSDQKIERHEEIINILSDEILKDKSI